jgi:hypothetical protein
MSTAPPQIYLPSAHAQVVDYGPAGTVPTIAGVTCFGETGKSKFGPIIFLVMGAVLFVGGIAALSSAGGAAIIAIVFGIVCAVIGFYMRRNQVHMDMVCDGNGIVVRRTSRKEGAIPHEFIPWGSIGSMQPGVDLRTQSTSEGDTVTRVLTYAIYANGALALNTDETRIKKLGDFIEFTGQHTSHLPYRWLHRKNAKGMPVLETVEAYVCVPVTPTAQAMQRPAHAAAPPPYQSATPVGYPPPPPPPAPPSPSLQNFAESVPLAPMGYSATASAPPSRGSYGGVPDYGPHGTVPTAAGAIHFGQGKLYGKGYLWSIVPAVLIVAFGLLGMLGGEVLGGGIILCLSLPFFALGFYFRRKFVFTDVICDEQGLTVRKASGRTGAQSPEFVPWRAVSETRCSYSVSTNQNSDNGVTTTTTTEHYSLAAQGRTVFEVSEKSIDRFAYFIGVCSQHTTHLGYRWVPRAAAQGLPVIETAGTYAKVPG